jgi:5'-deoxynucleotidase YfbR-like HD superfamily hydrolase
MMWGGGRGGGPGGQGGPGGGQVNAEQDALQKAIESNAPADEIKTKLAKYRASQKDKEAKLAKAQDDLRQVLTVKQEATAVLLGLLK